MDHPIHRVTGVEEVLGGYRLRLAFDDGVHREVDLEEVLEGELYDPLPEHSLFEKAAVDPEVQTIVWPNGADFDPAKAPVVNRCAPS